MNLAEKIHAAKQMKEQCRELEKEIAAEMARKPITVADEAELVKLQARADEVFIELGRRAPMPPPGTYPSDYRRSLLKSIQRYAKDYSGVDLDRADDRVLDVIEPAIYAEAKLAGKSAVDLPRGKMREIVRRDEGGHTVRDFVGNDCHFVQQFTRPAQK